MNEQNLFIFIEFIFQTIFASIIETTLNFLFSSLKKSYLY